MECIKQLPRTVFNLTILRGRRKVTRLLLLLVLSTVVFTLLKHGICMTNPGYCYKSPEPDADYKHAQDGFVHGGGIDYLQLQVDQRPHRSIKGNDNPTKESQGLLDEIFQDDNDVGARNEPNLPPNDRITNDEVMTVATKQPLSQQNNPPPQQPAAGGQNNSPPQQPATGGQNNPPPQQPAAGGQNNPPPQQPAAGGQNNPPPQQPATGGQNNPPPQQPGQNNPPPQQPAAGGQNNPPPQQPAAGGQNNPPPQQPATGGQNNPPPQQPAAGRQNNPPSQQPGQNNPPPQQPGQNNPPPQQPAAGGQNNPPPQQPAAGGQNNPPPQQPATGGQNNPPPQQPAAGGQNNPPPQQPATGGQNNPPPQQPAAGGQNNPPPQQPATGGQNNPPPQQPGQNNPPPQQPAAGGQNNPPPQQPAAGGQNNPPPQQPATGGQNNPPPQQPAAGGQKGVVIMSKSERIAKQKIIQAGKNQPAPVTQTAPQQPQLNRQDSHQTAPQQPQLNRQAPPKTAPQQPQLNRQAPPKTAPQQPQLNRQAPPKTAPQQPQLNRQASPPAVQNRFASSKTSFQQQQPEKRSPPPPPEKHMRPDEVAKAIRNGEMCKTVCPPFIWSEWSPCSKACGKGSRYRKAIYEFVCQSSDVCPFNRIEESVCDIPCKFDPEKYGGPDGLEMYPINPLNPPIYPEDSDYMCGHWLVEYEKIHNDILTGKRPPSYLVYSTGRGDYPTAGGMAGRLRGITTTFFMAVLLERAFLIEWVDPPGLEDYLIPKSFNWADLSPIQKLKRGPVRDIGSWRSSKESGRSSQWYMNTNFTTFFKFPVEVVQGHRYDFTYAVLRNPELMPKAYELGVDRVKCRICCAFDMLFKMAPKFEKEMSELLNSLGYPTRPLMAIQVRVKADDVQQAVSQAESFVGCAMRAGKELRISSKVVWVPIFNNRLVMHIVAKKYHDRMKTPIQINTATRTVHHHFGNLPPDTELDVAKGVQERTFKDFFLMLNSTSLIRTKGYVGSFANVADAIRRFYAPRGSISTYTAGGGTCVLFQDGFKIE